MVLQHTSLPDPVEAAGPTACRCRDCQRKCSSRLQVLKAVSAGAGASDMASLRSEVSQARMYEEVS